MRKSSPFSFTIRILAFISVLLTVSHAAFDPDDVFWDGRFDSLGTNARVSEITIDGSDVYVGGSFTYAGESEVNGIALWNGSTWSAIGSGVSGSVSEIALRGTDLYAGGNFSAAGGVPAAHIAKWDGISWSNLGGGITGIHTNPPVLGIEIIGDSIYAGGAFDLAGGITVNSIAMWDGSSWSSVGGGLGALGIAPIVMAMEIWNGYLYIGGSFNEAGGVPVNNFAKWDGSSWSPVTIFRGTMRSMTAVGSDLYVGGLFNFSTS
ncbi:MAG: hypothetical protein ABIA59_10085, partial [Candidatus Latescibacterota bacterium]